MRCVTRGLILDRQIRGTPLGMILILTHITWCDPHQNRYSCPLEGERVFPLFELVWTVQPTDGAF